MVTKIDKKQPCLLLIQHILKHALWPLQNVHLNILSHFKTKRKYRISQSLIIVIIWNNDKHPLLL